MKVLVTGGSGFIGSAFIRHLLTKGGYEVVNVDKLTYASNLESLVSFANLPSYKFERVDIADRKSMERVFREHRPDAVVHLAAESHVDRSIEGPAAFIKTNIFGTYILLETCLEYWRSLDATEKNIFRLHHVSTDEVYGDLGYNEAKFDEETAYCPSSPYSATKAASDHLVRAWHRTYGLPILLTNCSNNYGPYQFPEKLVPLMILNALKGKPLPVYGRGEHVRDWLHVEDHVSALELVLRKGRLGASYNIGGGIQASNIEVVHKICELLEVVSPDKPNGIARYSQLIRFVVDRPGHDLRYAVDYRKLQTELGWRPQHDFDSGIKVTIQWYVENRDWCDRTLAGVYDGQRLGLHGQISE